MKKCNTELMKEIKILEEKKNDILNLEQEECKITYIDGEKKMNSDYSYDEVRKEVDEIDTEIRRYKSLLAYSNATTIVSEFNMTIGECLIYLASLNSKKTYLTSFASKKQKTRISSTYNNKVEYTELLYDVNQVKQELEDLQRLIAKLQMALDRTNLTNLIEI